MISKIKPSIYTNGPSYFTISLQTFFVKHLNEDKYKDFGLSIKILEIFLFSQLLAQFYENILHVKACYFADLIRGA